MKTDRKLKRGLADLSKLFSEVPEPLTKKQEVQAISIEPPEDVSGENRPPYLIGATVLQSSGIFQPANLIDLADAFKAAFQETYLLTVAPQPAQYEAYVNLLHLSERENFDDAPYIQLHSIGDQMNFGCVSREQFCDIVRPRIANHPLYDFDGSKKALAIFDSAFSDPITSNILELVDHCILITSPDSNQLMQTYHQMRYCLSKNQFMRCSILLTGRGAGTLWELVYERFNEIVSKFLGCDLGFLGWVEHGVMQLNPELLLEEGRNFVQLPSKIRLSKALFDPILAE